MVSFLGVLCTGCGTLGNDLPSDEEMINTFHAKEATFNEMVQLLQEFPSWEGSNPGGYVELQMTLTCAPHVCRHCHIR